jgi:hypothetical protein
LREILAVPAQKADILPPPEATVSAEVVHDV